MTEINQNNGGMTVVRVQDKDSLEIFFRNSSQPLLHLYEIGDLDDFFWPHTAWYSLQDPESTRKFICLLYTGTDLPVVLAFGCPHSGSMLLANMLVVTCCRNGSIRT